MHRNRILILAAAELVIAVAFAAVVVAVVLYRRDDLWLQIALAVGGLAGLVNGAYLLKLRKRPLPRRRPANKKR